MTEIDIGIIGSGVMGKNLAKNIATKGYTVILNDVDKGQLTKMETECIGEDITGIYCTESFDIFISRLKRPQIIILMIKEGEGIDDILEKIVPKTDSAIVVDCGNSNWLDTSRRYDDLADGPIEYIGCGISGGHYGARNGPSMMVGGSVSGWNRIQPLLEKISARGIDGSGCVGWIGTGGAGHFIKMVHNGIEYAIMQCLAEIYQISGYDKEVMSKLNNVLGCGYLTEITSDILSKEEFFTRETVMDEAGQKGTGKWTVEEMASQGVAGQTVFMAVGARIDSANKELRGSRESTWKKNLIECPIGIVMEDLLRAFTSISVVSYIQGLELIRVAGENEGWEVDICEVLRIWCGGCIIRSSVVEWFMEIFKPMDKFSRSMGLIDHEKVREILSDCERSLRKVVGSSICLGIPVPVMSGTLAHLDSIRIGCLPTALTQAQRDYFGMHGIRYSTDPDVTHNPIWHDKNSEKINGKVGYSYEKQL